MVSKSYDPTKVSKLLNSPNLKNLKFLSVEDVYLQCETHELPKFKTTTDLLSTNEIYSQDRAVESIELGLGIRKPGYNIYVSGIQGTGKTSVLRNFLEQWAARSEAPTDWIYVNDFTGKEMPKVIRLPTGVARQYKKDLETFIKKLKDKITETLRGEKFENNVSARISSATERKSKLLSELESLAKGLSLEIKLTQHGIETNPTIDGEAVDEKNYHRLSPTVRQEIESNRAKLEPHILEFARQVRTIDGEVREYIDKHRDQVVREIVKDSSEFLLEKYQDLPDILHHIDLLKDSVISDLFLFVNEDDEIKEGEATHHIRGEDREPLKKYRVNVFVDNSDQKNAPIVIENNPTYYNLFGKIEKSVENGIYSTDFTMIKAGAVHIANGGYLVLNASDLLQNPAIWDTLKRVLRNQKAFIEDMGEQLSLLPTSGLRPEPMPLDIKVILVGSDEIYHLLYEMDEDFTKIFKVKADFAQKMPRNKANIRSYADFVASRCVSENLFPFDQSAVAGIVEFGSRLVENQKHLSTQFGDIKDLIIESDYMARQLGSKVVKREHINKAIKHKYYRHNLYEQELLELLPDHETLLEVDGAVVGQTNGLTVLDMGDYSFGRVVRLTAVSAVSVDGVFSIDKASKMSGKIHDKGLFICTSYLKALLAKKVKMGLSSSICFEQSYAGIDGDSASIAMLTTIISSYSQIPIWQNFAMTGSVNQFGEVQPVGGVNDKIEGFFKTIQVLGKKKSQYYVLIPKQNAKDLMLAEEVQEAVEAGWLNIVPVSHFYEVFELVTGVELGAKSVYESKFSEGSALDIIENKLTKIIIKDKN